MGISRNRLPLPPTSGTKRERILIFYFYYAEVEINRLFKTDFYNGAEHTLKTDYLAKMSKEKRSVLIGSCGRNDGKLKLKSSLMNDVLCQRKYDYRMLGLGVIKFTQ